MAKRKKTAKKSVSHRRRKIGAFGGNVDFMQVGVILAAAIGGKVLANKLAVSTNATMVKLAPYSPLIAGGALMLLVKSPLLKNAALGLVAVGATTAAGSTGLKIISGLEVIGYPGGYTQPRLSAAGNMQRINGPQSIHAGVEGNRSNFSGSGQRQIATLGSVASMNKIAAIAGLGCNCN